MTFKESIIFWLITGSLTCLAILVYRHWQVFLRFLIKQKINLFPVNFTVTFAFKFDKDLNSGKYYEEIKRIFLESINEDKLSTIIKLKDFSDIHFFQKNEEAENFKNKKNINLIVWGSFSNDALKRNGQSIIDFVPKFTYGFMHQDEVDDKTRVANIFDNQIKQILRHNNYWHITEENSKLDVSTIANNLYVVSLFTVALSFATEAKFKHAIQILEKLSYKFKKDDHPSIGLLSGHLTNLYRSILNQVLVAKKIDYQDTVSISLKILEIDSKDKQALASCALGQYEIGERDNSKKTVEKMLNFYPNDNLAKLDAAFINILDKKYNNALTKYKSIRDNWNVNNISFQPLEVVDFLEKKYQLTQEPALKFASGFLYCYLIGDSMLAQSDINIFLSKTSENIYGNMHKEAVQINLKKVIGA